MKFLDLISSIRLLPKARKHLVLINRQLKTVTYEKLLDYPYDSKNKSNSSIHVVVKSYFWASRLIYDCHCLPRSLGLYQHLKSLDYDVKHKFGVAKENKNLAAHAWVEYQHKPLNESIDLKNRFNVLD